MDENYLDDLLNEISSNPKQNKNFDNSVDSDSSVDINLSDLDDISLDELDDFDDLDLADFDLGDLSLDELDFDDLDVTRLDVKKEESVAEDAFEEDFSLEELIKEQVEPEEEAESEENFENLFQNNEPIESYNEATEEEIQHQDMGLDLDELLGGMSESEDAHFDSVFNEANNQVAEDTSFSEDAFDVSGDASSEDSGDSLDLDDLFSALGIEDENPSESPYTAGQEELDALFEASSASAMELGDLDDIEELPKAGGKKKKSKAKKGEKQKKTISEIVFGEPDEDDFEEEEYLKAKKEEKKEKKEANKVKKAEKKQASQEKKAANNKKKADEKNQKKQAKEAELRLEYEAEKNTKKLPTAVVVIVFAIFAAGAAIILLGSKEFNYTLLIKKAADYFDRQRYRLAYDEVSGIDIKEDDIELRDRIYTVMYVERLYESYENNMSLGRYDKALDALLRGLEKYDEHYDEAVELDIVEDIDFCRDKIITALDDVYEISEAEAYELMEYEGQEYSVILEEYCDILE